jgi:hypothetical protein
VFFVVAGERYNTVVGQADSESELRREVIHRLCLGDMSRSELMQGLPSSESEVSVDLYGMPLSYRTYSVIIVQSALVYET